MLILIAKVAAHKAGVTMCNSGDEEITAVFVGLVLLVLPGDTGGNEDDGS